MENKNQQKQEAINWWFLLRNKFAGQKAMSKKSPEIDYFSAQEIPDPLIHRSLIDLEPKMQGILNVQESFKVFSIAYDKD